MHIKSISKEQLIDVQQIAYNTWPTAYAEILSAQQLKYMLNKFYSIESLEEQLNNDHYFFLLVKNEKAIGFASCTHNYNNTLKSKLQKLYVLPSEQGLGCGLLLLEYVKKFCKNANSQFLILNVNRFNKAQHFYLKNNFKIISTEDIDIGNNYLMEDYVMECKL